MWFTTVEKDRVFEVFDVPVTDCLLFNLNNLVVDTLGLRRL
jgi:hypothetical protein